MPPKRTPLTLSKIFRTTSKIIRTTSKIISIQCTQKENSVYTDV